MPFTPVHPSSRGHRRTPSGFGVAQVCSEEGSELDAPLAEGFMTHLNAVLVEKFLHVSVATRRPHAVKRLLGAALTKTGAVVVKKLRGKRWR